MMKKIVFAFIFLLMSCALSYADQLNLIEPGWRVGPVVFSMTKADVETIYGKGAEYCIPASGDNPELCLLQYKQLGLDYVFNKNRIESVDILYPMYAVNDLARIASSVALVKSVMGDNFLRENYKHFNEVDIPDYKMIYKGIIFHIKQDRVVKITVKRIP